MIGTVLLGVLNLIFPGAALLWRHQIVQGIAYCLSFTILNVFRADIGAMWAIYVWVIAQIHFFKLRNPDFPRDIRPIGKKLAWTFTGLAMLSYAVLYGPSWTHGGEIKMPGVLFGLVEVALALPGLVLARYLISHRVRTADGATVGQGY